jgi:hypothetical protein
MVRLIDKETHMPVRGANIVLYEDDMPLITLTTDESGLGVVIIDGLGWIDNSWKVKVTSEHYPYWETELDQNDFYRIQITKMIHLPNQEYIVNEDGKTRVTDQMLLSALKSGRYELYDQSHYSGYLPALLEFTVEMEKVDRKPDPHRSDYERRSDREDQEDSEHEEYEESDEQFFLRLLQEAEVQYQADRRAARNKDEEARAKYTKDRSVFERAMTNDRWPHWRELPWEDTPLKGQEHGDSEGWYYFVFDDNQELTRLILHAEPEMGDDRHERLHFICRSFGHFRCASTLEVVEGKNNIWIIRCGD